ncbi:VWA domain-containing protein [Planctellipticum variicoloris]|uniref:VWA domain-containing protein n=1 Tax=Planctellipticum variicoloris TaxID=3064265 RepID=UPI0030133D30|nr:VWA domain-containing protein [Planctomycetaceae bacterium SH412]
MPGFEYSRWDGSQSFSPQSADELFDKLSEYLYQYGGELLDNLNDWEQEHPDVIDMLVKQGYVEKDSEGKYRITPRGIRRTETKALEQLFDVRGRGSLGRHDTDFRGAGQIQHEDSRPYQYGDPVSNLNLHETLRNAIQRQSGGPPIRITEDDLVVHETEYQTACATVVLLDMSGSMTRYGKYGAAKKVAMGLQALVRDKYRGDSIEVIGFYSYASPVNERELLLSAPKPVSIFDSRVRLRINLDQPKGFVPQHFTNIHAGLQLARRTLQRKSTQNRQIIVITDGEPTAHMEGRDLLLIYPPCEQTARVTLAEAKRCAAEGIHISSFALIEDYFYLDLVNFVQQMARVTGGVAAYCNADDLGGIVVESFVGGRRRRRSG